MMIEPKQTSLIHYNQVESNDVINEEVQSSNLDSQDHLTNQVPVKHAESVGVDLQTE